MKFASQLQDYKHRPRCPANFPAIRLHHKDAAEPADPEISWRVSHPSTIQAQCSLNSVFKWELCIQHGNTTGILLL
jgi:hypothetical protein